MAEQIVGATQEFDQVMVDIVDYVQDYEIQSDLAYETAWHSFLDTIGCGLESLEYQACTKLLGPLVKGTTVENGVKIPGTNYVLDPVQGAFNIGAMIRWLDFNDTWLAAEWGHPSDNLGAILATADWISRNKAAGQPLSAFSSQLSALSSRPALTMKDVLTAMVKAHEIQGILALETSFNRVGLDHVLLVRVASTAVTTALLGGSREQIINAVSNAWVED